MDRAAHRDRLRATWIVACGRRIQATECSMLTLTRGRGEGFVIGDDIRVVVRGIVGNKVRLSIDAPKDVPILRDELVTVELAAEPEPEQVA